MFYEEKQKFMDLFHEFCDVFAWSYADLSGFNPNIVQHAIPIKEDTKPVRQRQRLVNPTLESTIRKEVENMFATHIIFLVKYFEWVANIVLVRKKKGISY
jgi:hypothetical protein